MAAKMDEAMDMSLDDYIAMSKKSKEEGTTTPNGINDAKFGRRNNIEDEEEEEIDILTKEEYKETSSASVNDTGIWKGPDSSTVYLDCNDRHNDLRERLNSNCGRKQVSAVQCRLIAPNISADRPRGLPTLLPLDAYVKNQNNGYNNYYRNRGRNRNRNRGFNGFNNCNNNKNYSGIGMGGVNNGRIQRNRNPDLNKNFRFTIPNNGRQHNESQGTNGNMVIQCPSNAINLRPSAPLFNSSFQQQQSNEQEVFGNKSMPVGNLTPQAEAALNLNTNSNQVSNGSNDSLKSMLGLQGNISGDMMPVFAARLMELIKNNAQTPVHKPIYDMKIQKEIHQLQDKPLVYNCPGGNVVSSDGAGVNCQILPRTSGISLNCRFA